MTGWSTADNVLLIAMLLFGIRGAVRGFLRSLFGLLAVIVGFIVAALLYRDVAYWFSWIPASLPVRGIIAFLVLFLSIAIAIKSVGVILRKGAEISMMGGLDRVVGFFFGIVQAIVFLVVVVTIMLLSPGSDRLYQWMNQGNIAPIFTAKAELLANKTRDVTSDMRNEMLKRLQAWGVSPVLLDRITADPALIRELANTSEQHKPPAALPPPHPNLYAKLQPVLSNDSLTARDKARMIWDLLQTERMPAPAGTK